MRKHEMSYHDYSNDIFFLSNHCSHLEAFERFFFILSTQIKEMLQESRKKINNFKLTRILKRDEKIELSLFIQRNQKIIKKSKTKKLIEIEIEIEIKNLTEIVIQKKKKRKQKRKTKKSIVIKSSDSKIYMIETTSFNLLIRQKEARVFVLFFREIDA
jgi:hypothetical protein